MGCGLSTQTVEYLIESKENALGFHHYTIGDLQQAFFYMNEGDRLEEVKLQRAFATLNYICRKENQKLLEAFLAPFFLLYSEHYQRIYSYSKVMMALFVISKEPTKTKARELYRFADTACSDQLSIDQVETLFTNLFTCIAEYSMSFAEFDHVLREKYTPQIKGEIAEFLAMARDIFFPVTVDTDPMSPKFMKLTEEEFLIRYESLEAKLETALLTPRGIRQQVMRFCFKDPQRRGFDSPSSKPISVDVTPKLFTGLNKLMQIEEKTVEKKGSSNSLIKSEELTTNSPNQ